MKDTATSTPGEDGQLLRRMGLARSTATKVLGMVGVGPFLTIPFMITALNGPHIIFAWVAGALLSVADGLVYAQLRAAFPEGGGPPLYLREAYKPLGLGRLMSFVVIFQILLVAPLSVAGAAVGFTDYLGFVWTGMSPLEHYLVAALVCGAVTALLYRDVESVGKLWLVVLIGVLLTTGWVILAGLFEFSPRQAFDLPPQAFRLDGSLLRRLGAASLLAMYSYGYGCGGYDQVCNITGKVRSPEKVVARSIIVSVVVVATIYILMSVVIVGLIPWPEAMETRAVASVFVARTFHDPAAGRIAGVFMTGLILFVAASLVYAFLLEYSRMPYAAARDGHFFRVFARVHPTKHFPRVSLITLGLASIPFCFFTLGQLVSWLIQVQILLRFVWQSVAVMLLRSLRKDIPQPFTTRLYPLPAVASFALWLYMFVTGPREGIVLSVVFLGVAVGFYFLFERRYVRVPRGDFDLRDGGRRNA